MLRNEEEWIDGYKKKDALWIHDGNPKRPHALLTSGMHSNGFFNSKPIIAHEILLHDAARDLLELFLRHNGRLTNVQGVVGPKTGATKLAEYMSDYIKAATGEPCFSASPAKSEDGKSMIFSDEERALLPNKLILPCDDVLTTCGSVDLAAEAVKNANGTVLPYVLVLVNRSGLTEANSKKIIALINRPMPMWNPEKEKCPLCEQGSEAIRPKEGDNWTRLNAAY